MLGEGVALVVSQFCGDPSFLWHQAAALHDFSKELVFLPYPLQKAEPFSVLNLSKLLFLSYLLERQSDTEGETQRHTYT